MSVNGFLPINPKNLCIVQSHTNDVCGSKFDHWDGTRDWKIIFCL